MIPQRLSRSTFVAQRVFPRRTYATSQHRVDAHNQEEAIAPTEYTLDTETTSKEVPYTPKGEHGESQDKRYGGMGSYEPDKTHEGGGAESENAGGRFPEKR
ncbi:hypothetical protein BDV98DRAFT_565134 [Pterulicium gracile]|uniref:Uncharacterized protein n=1 Tax=Pterulicium gracile TaxID=1884261 RepID=A0A5C3QNL9_9AGAR|nr:hypothetical protein BDV98DRAFT_565134 [Pterula gracilis]